MTQQLDDIIRHIRSTGAIAGLISNGYYFTPDRIKRLNAAGLEYLQISIDNVDPDEVSRKSLRVLDKKLRYLSEHSDFHININSVIGGGITGALLGHALTMAGYNVIVVDRRYIGWGSTSASTAILQYEIDEHLVERRLEALRCEARNRVAEQPGRAPDLDPLHGAVGEAGRADRHLREHHGRALDASAAEQARRLLGVARHADAVWMQYVHRLLVYAECYD